MMDGIDWRAVFLRLPSLTGLPLVRGGDRWYGACYLDGRKHARHDKTVCVYAGNGIVMMEQGGERMTLFNWLVNVRGLSRHDAGRMLAEGGSVQGQDLSFFGREGDGKPKFVDPSFLDEGINARNALKSALCRVFSPSVVEEHWQRYKVRQRGSYCVFWYIDRKGRICHDKMVSYSGFRRDRTKAMGRAFRKRDGYSSSCLFGEHLLAEGTGRETVCVVESEKSALVCSMRYPERIWLATGGKNNTSSLRRLLAEEGDRVVLFPDVDAVEDWERMYGTERVFRWWEWYGCETGATDDFADFVVRRARRERTCDGR